jgi:mRNA interferase MazF
MRPGEIVWVDFGIPAGSEPGFVRPAILITAELVLQANPRTVHVVPITSNTQRSLPSEVALDNVGLERPSVAQCHLCTVISTARITSSEDLNVGPLLLQQMRSIISDLLDL